MKHLIVTAAALLVTLSPALARSKIHHATRGTPIVAGQPGILVSPGGEVLAPAGGLGARDMRGTAQIKRRPVRPQTGRMP